MVKGNAAYSREEAVFAQRDDQEPSRQPFDDNTTVLLRAHAKPCIYFSKVPHQPFLAVSWIKVFLFCKGLRAHPEGVKETKRLRS